MEDERTEYKGFYYRIEPDSDPVSPREWDNFGKMICFHRRYSLGDKHNLSLEEAKELETRKNVVSLPLYLYDHSGLRMKVGSFRGLLPQGHAEFDSGKVGFIYADSEMIKKEYGVKRITKALREKVTAILEQEVKTYDQYLSGDVYGYIVEDEAGNNLDSCCGCYGVKDCEEEAHAVIEFLVKEREADLELRKAGSLNAA